MSPQALLATVAALRERMQGTREERDIAWEELQAEVTLLAREKQRYAEFFQYAPDPYFITDAGGSVREVNEAALELLQAARDDVVGQPLSGYIANRVGVTVRAVALGQSGAAGLCWLLRPAP